MKTKSYGMKWRELNKIQEDMIDNWDGLESTDQDMAQALKDIRDQEVIDQSRKFEKHSKRVPKLNLDKVQEIIRLKWDDSSMSYGEEEEEEPTSFENSNQMSIRNYTWNDNANESSQDEVSDYKKNIKLLLQSSIKKSKIEDSDRVEKTNLFDYQMKHSQNSAWKGQSSQHSIIQSEHDQIEDDEKSLQSDQYMLYDDSSSSCESYYSQDLYQSNKNNPVVPMLNLGGFKKKGPSPVPMLNLGSVSDPNNKMNAEPIQVPPPIPPPEPIQTKLVLENIKKKDFQDEFMDKYDEFSESWRQLIEQEKRF